MDISPKLKKILARFSAHNFMYAWYRQYKILFLLLFLGTLGLAGYFWHFSLFRYQWTDQQKKAYLEQYFKETSFRGEEYNRLVEHLKMEREKHQRGPELKRDIFTGENLE